MEQLEKVEKLRQRANVSYEEAKGALVACNWDMLDAMVHPERHQSLIVRVGGLSEYFIRLSPALQETILNRTEH